MKNMDQGEEMELMGNYNIFGRGSEGVSICESDI